MASLRGVALAPLAPPPSSAYLYKQLAIYFAQLNYKNSCDLILMEITLRRAVY